MSTPPSWAGTAVRALAPLSVLLLVGQYLLGLWTNVYAPAGGFNSNTSFPSLDWHYMIGDTLGILAILLIVFAGLSRQVPAIVLSVVLFIAVLVAGFAGQAFVGSTPNPPSASVTMGAMFLVAFVAALGLTFGSWRGWAMRPSGVPTPAPV
ncbi:MAG TPA: hypothetical protein VGV89_00435 [Thermoplasmata archaeon]|nr:hypothetical protein [Thermoplasmata archaeon]